MMLTAITLLLLSAEPAAPTVTGPALVVVSTSAPGLEKVAADAGRTLGTRLEAPTVELGGYLKSRGEGCQEDPRCLLAAPGLEGVSRLLHLSLRPLAPGRLAVDLRLIEPRGRKVLGRSASVVEQGELAAWMERASRQLLTRADPNARKPPPSPFARKPPAPPPPLVPYKTAEPPASPAPVTK